MIAHFEKTGILCMTSSVLGNGRVCLCPIWETHCFVMQKQSSGKKNAHPSSVSPSAFRVLSDLSVAVSWLDVSPPDTPPCACHSAWTPELCTVGVMVNICTDLK